MHFLVTTAIVFVMALSASAQDKAKIQQEVTDFDRARAAAFTKGDGDAWASSGAAGRTHRSLASMIDRFDGTIILLDWDNRVPRLASHRIRHLDDLGKCGTGVLLAMMVGVTKAAFVLFRNSSK